MHGIIRTAPDSGLNKTWGVEFCFGLCKVGFYLDAITRRGQGYIDFAERALSFVSTKTGIVVFNQ